MATSFPDVIDYFAIGVLVLLAATGYRKALSAT
jgi:hypothetical protein